MAMPDDSLAGVLPGCRHDHARHNIIMNTPRILIVDDEPLNLELIAGSLDIFGYEGIPVTSGRAALAQLQTDTVDLVLLDVMMPEMDGLTTAKRIRERFSPADLPIIMVTALSSKADRLRAVEAGANDFITKPVDKTELRVRMDSQLKLKELQDQLKAYQVNLESVVDQRTKELRSALQTAEAAQRSTFRAYLDTINRLGIAAEYKDKDTADHIRRMSSYCVAIAQGLDLSQREITILGHASPMHDVGKIGIPDAILLKPGPLTEDEWVIMKQHATIGGKILEDSDSEVLQAGRIIALTHHERWDGTGYPAGLAGEDIPIFGRISAVADVFDALTSVRPYKEAYTAHKALEILRAGRNSHFDPQVLDAFFLQLDQILAIMKSGVLERQRQEGVTCSMAFSLP